MKKITGSLMMVALFITSLNLRLAINSISPILENIRNDLGMSASIASLLTSIPVLCMGIFSPIAAKLGNRWGIERVIGWSLAFIGFGTILRFFSNSTLFLLLTAFIAGVGIAAVGPLLSGFIKRYFQTKVPSMIAIYTVALTIGAALASGLTAPLQTSLNWQGALAIWAIFAIIAVPVWWLFVLHRIKKTTNQPSVQQEVKMPWGNKTAWLLTLSFGLMAMLFYSVTAWLPPIIQNMGYSKMYAGNVLTIFVVVQIPVSLLLPVLLKRIPSRLTWLLIASSMELIGFLMILFAFEPWIAALFIGIGAGSLFPLNLLLPIDATKNAQEAASWAAMTQSIGYIIGSAGPILLGWIHDSTKSFSLAIIGMAMIAVIMMVVQILASIGQAKDKDKNKTLVA
ncbi:CynX/NimT family MFS transporter [Shimazuella kribbensis]|uniref:MFS transporter n=1 Tax=Shimazuella kribbensis TaxID=139808 RepID=UPI0004076934|nr:MFS transporter [Shimazuella kribbensis]